MSDALETGKTAQAVAKPDRARLFDIAAGQGGYFTAEQASGCGFSRALLSHHAKSGAFIRVRRGLYRFREYPAAPREHVLAAWLALGKDSAVVSHDSALEILDLTDVVPDAVHLTVPRSRRNLPSLSGVRIHTSSRALRPEDTVIRDGISVTSATRSILDAAEAGTSPEQIELAVRQSVERGLTMRDELQRAADERGRRVASLISRALLQPRA
jgi:predicted transcriptional regulator of viral defense system